MKKLTSKKATEIRRLLLDGLSCVVIAEKYGVSEKTVRNIRDGKIWRNEIMDFGKALEKVKQGEKIFRLGWNGKGMFVVYQKGYPQGIPSNKQTAEAWGLNEGELFKCEPYLQIKTAQGSHAMWVPSIGDILADDWEYIR